MIFDQNDFDHRDHYTKIRRSTLVMLLLFHCHAPMQLVAPRAVTIAVAILAIICTMNFNVSLFVMIL